MLIGIRPLLQFVIIFSFKTNDDIWSDYYDVVVFCIHVLFIYCYVLSLKDGNQLSNNVATTIL